MNTTKYITRILARTRSYSNTHGAKTMKQESLSSTIIAYEAGRLTQLETVGLFALLVGTGVAYELQGSYGKTARRLVKEGYITDAGLITEKAHEELSI